MLRENNVVIKVLTVLKDPFVQFSLPLSIFATFKLPLEKFIDY